MGLGVCAHGVQNVLCIVTYTSACVCPGHQCIFHMHVYFTMHTVYACIFHQCAVHSEVYICMRVPRAQKIRVYLTMHGEEVTTPVYLSYACIFHHAYGI